jgi:hypothetical protein
MRNIGRLMNWKVKRLVQFFVLLYPLFFGLSARTHAAQVATTLADSGAGSLRQAISSVPPSGTITFATNGTIFLTSGELVISKPLIIAGSGTANLIVSGSQSNRVFNVGSNLNVRVSDLTITGGKAADDTNGAPGGGVYNAGVLTLNNCIVTGNAAGNGISTSPLGKVGMAAACTTLEH